MRVELKVNQLGVQMQNFKNFDRILIIRSHIYLLNGIKMCIYLMTCEGFN